MQKETMQKEIMEELVKKPSGSDYALLHEIGFLATGCGLHKQARRIFIALADMDSANETPFVGLAIVDMNEGKWKDAVKTIEERALKIKPDSEAALCFLALALNKLGHGSQMQTVVERILARGSQGWAMDLAKALMPSQRQEAEL